MFSAMTIIHQSWLPRKMVVILVDGILAVMLDADKELNTHRG